MNVPPRTRIGDPFGVLALAITLSACAHFPVNPPLDRIDTDSGYRFQNLALNPGNTDDTFVILSLSGGGTRAAALDYGVLRHLAGIEIAGGGSLLDEVDLITASSAASLVTGYWAAFGRDALLERFGDDVLTLPIQSKVLGRFANPVNWPRLWSGKFGRSDLAAEYLDRTIFHGATFADADRMRPMLIMNATDLTGGAQFSFTQAQFDPLCSSLDHVSIARAVTASLAFSGGFTPITFRNYPSGTCQWETPGWVEDVLQAGFEARPRDYDEAEKFSAFERPEREWIHLVDGGVSDNIGIRSARAAFAVRNTPWSIVDRIESGQIRRLAIILVDARKGPDYSGDAKAKSPGLVSTVGSSAGNPLAAFSSETVELVREGLASMNAVRQRYEDDRRRCDELAVSACGADDETCLAGGRSVCYETFEVRDEDLPPIPETYFVHARFAALDDTDLRHRLQSIPTTLQLPADIVTLLVDSAPALLEASDDFVRLVGDLSTQQ